MQGPTWRARARAVGNPLFGPSRERPVTASGRYPGVSGLHLPPEPGAGDESTVGGYAAVHGRPAAFEGLDGFSYSVEPTVDETGEPHTPWGGYFLFLRWKRVGASGIEGHLESDFVVRAATEGEALTALGRVPLLIAKATLDTLVRKRSGGDPDPPLVGRDARGG